MSETDLVEKLHAYFKAEALSDEELTDESPLLESGILDSLAIVKLLTFLEESFGVEITDDEFDPDNFESVAAIAELVAAKKAG